MHGVVADSNTSAWTFGSSMITFVFPMILFLAVAAALYVLYTKPELFPGRRQAIAQPAIHTAQASRPEPGAGE